MLYEVITGNKERLVPMGQEAQRWLVRFTGEGRPALLGERRTDVMFPSSSYNFV